MTNLNTFNFNSNEIRVVEIDGEPWFVGMDVINLLNLYPSEYRRLDDDQKSYLRRSHLGLAPGKDAVVVSESGLYKLVMRSDKAEARDFQDWVTRTVLPAIRKDGTYVMGEEKVATGEMPEDELLLKAITAMVRKMLSENELTLRRVQGKDRNSAV
jgi:prophage antirepressor-like protein